MKVIRSMHTLTPSVALLLLFTACDGKHSLIGEYDCFASNNGCPEGFECETEPGGRAVCVERRGSQGPEPPLNSAPARTTMPDKDGVAIPKAPDRSMAMSAPQEKTDPKSDEKETPPRFVDSMVAPDPQEQPDPDYCPDGSERLILLLGRDNRLVTFNPIYHQFSYLTTVDCSGVLPPSIGRAQWQPYSMAVAPDGTAWIGYAQFEGYNVGLGPRTVDITDVRGLW